MHILIIEDNFQLQCQLVRMARSLYPTATINTTDNAPDAIEELEHFEYQLVVSDFDLTIGTGGQVLDFVRGNKPALVDHFILMSGNPEAIEATGHTRCLEKPCRRNLILAEMAKEANSI